MQGLKIGRNDPCPCGSGKKYKKCCPYEAASPLPILRYDTPREAAETATGRERLEALFWQFEWQPTGDNAFEPDIPRLKKTLGVE